jgi:hypothetical protein
MKHRDDPSVKKNSEEMREREKKEWWMWWAENVDAQHIIAVWKDMYDWDIDKVNEVLKAKWYLPIDKRPEKWDYLYIDF